MITKPVPGTLYRARRSPKPDSGLAHAAVEEVRRPAAENVINAIGAQIGIIFPTCERVSYHSNSVPRRDA